MSLQAQLITAMTLFTAGTAQADTLEQPDGRLLEDIIIGSSNGIIEGWEIASLLTSRIYVRV
jgi:hypothetical protein